MIRWTKHNLCKLLIFFAISGFVSCQGQEKEKQQSTKTTINKPKIIPKDSIMEKFNIEEFNKHQKNEEWNFIDKKENKIREIKDREYYFITIQPKYNEFSIEKAFYLNGILAQKGYRYKGNGFTKGIWTDYNQQGNIIKQTDYDAPYKNFPWEKVKLWLEDRKINLLDPFTWVSRSNENSHPIWYLSWDTKKLDKYGNQIIQDIELDGRTGKVLKENSYIFRDCGM